MGNAELDEVEQFFDDCYEDRLETVVNRLHDDSTLINSRRHGDRTPLHQAAFGGAERVAKLLIGQGADVNARTEYGWVPLHYAAAPDSEEVAHLLLKNGAALDRANDEGLTPLHFAVDFGKFPMAKLLLAQGADPNVRDGKGRTPLDFASPGSPLADLLRSKGAVSGGGPLIEEPQTELPEWLAGKEDAISELLEKVNEHWHVPDQGKGIEDRKSE